MSIAGTPGTPRVTEEAWWGIGAVVASALIATAAAYPIYAHPRVWLVAAVAVPLGVGSVVIARMLRLHAVWTASVVVVGYLIAVVPVAVPSALGAPGRILRGVVDGIVGVVLGWKQLLTVSLPAAEYQAVLVPLLLVLLVGSLAASALVVAGGRWAPVAVVPMLGMTVFGAAFGSPEVGPDVVLGPVSIPAPLHVLLGLLAVAVCLVWLVSRMRLARNRALRAARDRAATVRQRGESRVGALRRQALAAGIVLVAVAAGLLAAPLARDLGPREALREGIDPLLLLERQPSLLATYRGWFAGNAFDEELFRVRGAAGVERLRIATLDSYDGHTFRVSSSADAAGVRFTRVPRTDDRAAELTVTIGPGYSGAWVPLAEAGDSAPIFTGPRAEELAAAYYASVALDAGIVVTDGDDVGLRAGDSYRIPAASARDEVFLASVGGDELLDQDAYPALAAWVEEQEVGRSGADLLELVERLRSRGYLSHALRFDEDAAGWVEALQARADYEFTASRAGHSTARIEELFRSLVEQQRRAGAGASDELLIAGIGDDEQFATAAALLARQLGFDSRVVVGVRMGDAGADDGVPPCTEVCTGANVTVWAEARAASGDWAVLDATPQFVQVPSTISPSEVPPENPTAPREPVVGVLDPPAAVSDETASNHESEATDDVWADSLFPALVTVGVSALALALLLLPLFVFPVLKSLRRRWRRRARASEVAIVGAWHELIDHYVDYRQTVPEGLTRVETADAMDRPMALALAELVDQAVFADQPPTAEDGAQSWRLVDEETRQLSAQLGIRARLRAFFTPTSLMRRIPVASARPPHGRKSDVSPG